MIELNLIELKAAAMVLRSVQNPVRKTMINLIHETPGITVKEIYGTMRLEQPVASLHLGILRKSGIVRTVREGKLIHYYLDDNIESILLLANQLAKFFS